MKLFNRIFFVVLLVLASADFARANIAVVNNLNANGSSVICVPGGQAKMIAIQNTGSTNSVRISFDGGVGYIDPLTGKTGTNPTPTTGYLLPAGQQIILTMLPQTSSTGNQDPGFHRPIVAIMVTGTTTISITTDDYTSTFPTT